MSYANERQRKQKANFSKGFNGVAQFGRMTKFLRIYAF